MSDDDNNFGPTSDCLLLHCCFSDSYQSDLHVFLCGPFLNLSFFFFRVVYPAGTIHEIARNGSNDSQGTQPWANST